MAPEPLVEFVLEKKLHAGVYQPGTAEHQKWQELQAHFMESGGRAWWHGPVLEDAELSLGVQIWPSHDAFTDLIRSPSLMTMVEKVSTLRESAEVLQGVLEPDYEAIVKVLDAPVTEVLTARGIEPGFLDNMKTFTANMAAQPPKGYLGAAFGVIGHATSGKGMDSRVVRWIAGWESLPAHTDAKSDTSSTIAKNIWLLREKRESVSLFHATLKRL